MCDYSLQHAHTRDAKVGDKLVTRRFGSGTTGFVEADTGGEPINNVAICLRPGTEIAFNEPPATGLLRWFKAKHKVAIFRQINKDLLLVHHDAVEMPDGETILLNALDVGRTATVLQLPAAPKTNTEAEDQQRLEVVA